jgi:hypothetical protein
MRSLVALQRSPFKGGDRLEEHGARLAMSTPLSEENRLAEQVAWLDWRSNALEEEAGQVRAEIMAAVNDPESLEMEACLASPEQIDQDKRRDVGQTEMVR